MNFRKTIATMIMAATSVAAIAVPQTVRIMTYNVPMGNILVTDGNGRNTWENRCAEIHKYVLGVAPDVLGMQEPVRQELCDVLRGLPGYAMVGTGRDDGLDKGEYTPILYRIDKYRVIDTGNYWLTETPDVHSRVEGSSHYRIATWALLEDLESGARFLYTNTHLSYDRESVRYAQIKIMKQHMLDLNERFGKTVPHYLTGDFNMYDSEENYTYVLNWKLLMKDMWTSARDRKHYSNGNKAPTNRIDYIYGTKDISSRMARWENRKTPDGFWMSDHDPLWAETTFNLSIADQVRGAAHKALAEIDSTQAVTQLRTRLVQTATQVTSSPLTASYPIRNAIDLNSSTFIQTLNKAQGISQPHYIQVNLRQDLPQNLRFSYCPRGDNGKEGLDDRWSDILVEASEDGEEWEYIRHFYHFGENIARSVASDNIALRGNYKHLRFSVLRTPGMTLRNGHPQWGLAEFQLYANELTADCLYSTNEEVRQAADALNELVKELRQAANNGTAVRADIARLEDATEALHTLRMAATPIEKVMAHKAHTNQIYDLQGRPVSQPKQGIYLVNGKKMMYK